LTTAIHEGFRELTGIREAQHSAMRLGQIPGGRYVAPKVFTLGIQLGVQARAGFIGG